MNGGLLDPKMFALLSAAGGLLQASAPSRNPVGLGGAISQGLLSGLQGYGTGVQLQRTGELVGLEKKKVEALEQELKQKQARFDLSQSLLRQYGLLGPSAGAPGSGSGGLLHQSVMSGSGNYAPPEWALPQQPQEAPTSTQPPTQQPTQQPQAGFPFGPQQLAALRLAGMPDLTPAYNASLPNVEVRDGVMYDKKSGHVMGTIPTMNPQGFSTQLIPDGQGGYTVGQTPGALDAFTAQQDAAEAAKARRDPFLGMTDPSGRPIPMTREQFSQKQGGIQVPGSSPSGLRVPSQGMGPTPGDKKYIEVVSTKSGERDLTEHDTARAALENVTKLGTVIGHLNTSQAITGMGAEFLRDVERAKQLVMQDQASGKKVSDTELLDALLGSDVFPMIKALGIGARGLDTPAEREFLRSVMTGVIPMNKETLTRMAKMRLDISKRVIGRWNDRVGSGELDRYFSASGMPKQKIQLPEMPSDASGGFRVIGSRPAGG